MKHLNPFLTLGITGLLISVILNALGVFVFHKAAAIPFSDGWWSSWFPSFVIWPTFLIVGFATRRPKKTTL